MAPQPLLKVINNKQLSISYLGGLENRPELAVLVAQSIALWADAETKSAELFAEILGIHARAAIAMFLELQSDNVKTTTMNAAVQKMLRPHEKNVFDAVMRKVKACQKERNKLVHWTWGTSPHLPDRLLLTDPIARISWQADLVHLNNNNVTMEGGGEFTYGIYDNTWVYTKRDLEETVARMNRARILLVATRDCFSFQAGPERDVALLKLSEQPDIHEVLSHQQTHQKTNPSIPE